MTTIDRGGLIVVPKSVRDEARLFPGTRIQIRCRNGIVEIEAAPLAVTMRKRGGLTVASPKQPGPPATGGSRQPQRGRVRDVNYFSPWGDVIVAQQSGARTAGAGSH